MADRDLTARIARSLAGSAPANNPARSALKDMDVGTASRLFDSPLVPAAVLVPVVAHPEPTLLLTLRPDHLKSHPGQISFPGGKVEAEDDGPAGTALRETLEETGIGHSHVEIAGYLPPHAVVTGFAVTPVVGFVTPGFELRPDTGEVAEVFEVPLQWLLDPHNAIETLRERRGVTLPMVEFRYGERRIWGATAMMIRSLINIIESY